MPRHPNPDLLKQWKITLPATVAGSIEHVLWDQVHGRPHYASRSQLVTTLLNIWLDHISGREPRPLPSLEEIRKQ